MELSEDPDRLVRQYLLGNLCSDEQERFEERLLTDKRWYETLCVGEDELIEDYFEGQLSEADRERFASHFLSAPERRDKMRFARTLREYAATPPAARAGVPESTAARAPIPLTAFWSSQRPILRYAAGLLAFLLLSGQVWLAISLWRMPASAVAVSLTPSLFRGEGETQRAVVPPEALVVELRLDIGLSEHTAYRAALRSADGSEILTRSRLSAETLDNTTVVVFEIPARALPVGDYIVELSGIGADGNREVVGQYAFRAAP